MINDALQAIRKKVSYEKEVQQAPAAFPEYRDYACGL